SRNASPRPSAKSKAKVKAGQSPIRHPPSASSPGQSPAKAAGGKAAGGKKKLLESPAQAEAAGSPGAKAAHLAQKGPKKQTRRGQLDKPHSVNSLLAASGRESQDGGRQPSTWVDKATGAREERIPQ
ncbi:unnamed protein product, partial [Polarella glacialis]